MDGFAQNGGGLEDRLRRMILLNGSVPDDVVHDNRPRVRLPPTPPNFGQQPPGSQPHALGQHAGIWYGSASGSPASPQAFSLPILQGPPQAPPPQFVPPHLRHAPLGQTFISNSPPPQQMYAHSPGPQPGPPLGFHQGRPGSIGNVGPFGPPRGNGMSRQQPRQQRTQHIQLDPDAFQRGGPVNGNGRPPPAGRNLYDPNARHAQPNFVRRDFGRVKQAQYLEQIASREVSAVEMSEGERDEKEQFRIALEQVCQRVAIENPKLPKVTLECFGSFKSGFASAGSDMDLAIVLQDEASADACFSMLEDDLPRSLERALLQAGYGARLLTRTRVPIIKICQTPGSCLLDKLRQERWRWDSLPNEKKYPHLHKEEDERAEDALPSAVTGAEEGRDTNVITPVETTTVETTAVAKAPNASTSTADPVQAPNGSNGQEPRREQPKTWTRERKAGPLDFPKDGIGIQCDINFFNPLGLHNTQMLRCYSLCDTRVRPMVLFVKSWAKQRKINSSYSGSLSSYGYVMMVLHYLINVVQPPVLPNLQTQLRPNSHCTPHGANRTEVDGWVVDFWRNENEIEDALRAGQMSANTESLGSLLAGFFQYYSSMGAGSQFRWTTWVLSLRTPGGIMTKHDKGWVKATTEEGDGKKIQHRYLFCIEDPFELSHNIARTVTHNGIVAIRDEFRRAYRILNAVSQDVQPRDGGLFDKLVEDDEEERQIREAVTKRNNEILGITTGDEVQATKERVEQSRLKKHSKHPHQRNQSGAANQPSQNTHTAKPKTKPLDVDDQDAFPTLGAAKNNTSRRKKSSSGGGSGGANKSNFNEISGDRAAAYLEEFRRKKAEAQAETTAYGAAEMVLNGDD